MILKETKMEQLSSYEILENKLKELYCNELVDILLYDEQIKIDFKYHINDDDSEEKIQDFVDYISGYDAFDEKPRKIVMHYSYIQIKEMFPYEFYYLPKKQG